MRVINISLNEYLYFMNDQDKPKDNNPRIINVFSLVLKLTKSFKKKFAKIYKKDAPMLNPRITTKVPNHLPSMKPANKAIGDPNPKNGKTQRIVNAKKIICES